MGALGNKLGFPDDGAADAFWGDKWMPDGELTVLNLNNSEKIQLCFYGSRHDVADNRKTKYEVL